MPILQGCITDPPVPEQKELKLGDVFGVGTYDIPVKGRVIFFNPEDTTNSIKITFPANSYSSTKSVTLSKTRIKNSSFGEDIHPDSFLYSFDLGGEYSAKNIFIDIPIFVDTSLFSMAFLYDKITRDLDGIPTVRVSKTTPKRLSVIVRRSGSFFVSSIAKSKLNANVQTSFDPKLDNWEFPNYGTVISPTGQFAGQSLSALWYFYEQAAKGNPHLYGHFDADHGAEQPKVWQDNNVGLQWAAETQQKLKWDAIAFQMIAPIDNGNVALTTSQLKYSILVTGKPQLISIIKDSTVLPLIVYKVENGTLYVADPNLPTTAAQIHPSVGAKTQYQTGVSMHALLTSGAKAFIDPTYLGARALIDWDAIGKTFESVNTSASTAFASYAVGLSDKSGKITSTGSKYISLLDKVFLTPPTIPASLYQIYRNGAFTPYDPTEGIALAQGDNTFAIYSLTFSPDMNDTLWTNFQTLTVEQAAFLPIALNDTTYIESDIVLRSKLVQQKPGQYRYVWDMGDGTPVIRNTNIDSIKYRYKQAGVFTVRHSIWLGDTTLGVESVTIRVYPNSVAISPNGISVLQNISYPFFGSIKVPNDIIKRYEWDMGDGSAKKSVINTDSMFYSYKNTGSYTIALNVFDNTTNVLLGRATSSIIVTQGGLPTLAQLQSMKYVKVLFYAKHAYHSVNQPYEYNQAYTWSFFGGGNDTSSQRIIWNGSSYTTIKSSSTSSDIVEPYSHAQSSSGEATTIKGSFNSNFLTTTISASYASSYSDKYTEPFSYRDKSESTTRGFDCQNVFISKNTQDTITFILRGPISNVFSHIRDDYQHDESGTQVHGPHHYTKYVSTYWNDPLNIPTVTVTFTK